MELGAKHPKRVFVARTIELEIRLSYYDRVKGTIPEEMLKTGVVADDAPGPANTYEEPGASLLSRLEDSRSSLFSQITRTLLLLPRFSASCGLREPLPKSKRSSPRLKRRSRRSSSLARKRRPRSSATWRSRRS